MSAFCPFFSEKLNFYTLINHLAMCFLHFNVPQLRNSMGESEGIEASWKRDPWVSGTRRSTMGLRYGQFWSILGIGWTPSSVVDQGNRRGVEFIGVFVIRVKFTWNVHFICGEREVSTLFGLQMYVFWWIKHLCREGV